MNPNPLNKLKLLTHAPLPRNIIKQREKSGRTLDYIGWESALDALESVCDRIDIEFPEHWIQESTDKVVKNKNNNNQTTDNIPQRPVVFVKCRITLKYFDEKTNAYESIVREAFGSQVVIGGQDEQQSHFKAAASDALKKAIAYFGIGREMYRNQETTEFFISLSSHFKNSVLQKMYAEEANVIRNVMIKYNISNTELNSAIYWITKGKDWTLTPANIKEVSEILKKTYPLAFKQENNDNTMPPPLE